MSNVNCNVNNCSNNDKGVCYAGKISVSGKRSHTSTHTNCSSFIDASNASFSNSADNSAPCSFVECNVKTCTYQAGTVCSLNNIAVTSLAGKPNNTADTYCSSFKSR